MGLGYEPRGRLSWARVGVYCPQCPKAAHTLASALSCLGCGLFTSSMWVGLLCRGVGSLRDLLSPMVWVNNYSLATRHNRQRARPAPASMDLGKAGVIQFASPSPSPLRQ